MLFTVRITRCLQFHRVNFFASGWLKFKFEMNQNNWRLNWKFSLAKWNHLNSLINQDRLRPHTGQAELLRKHEFNNHTKRKADTCSVDWHRKSNTKNALQFLTPSISHVTHKFLSPNAFLFHPHIKIAPTSAQRSVELTYTTTLHRSHLTTRFPKSYKQLDSCNVSISTLVPGLELHLLWHLDSRQFFWHCMMKSEVNWKKRIIKGVQNEIK